MKKTYVIAAAMLVTMGANAQVMEKDIVKKERMLHWGVEAGLTLNNLYHLQDEFQTSNMLKVGGHGGVVANIGSGRWAFQPGVRYIMKGAVITTSSNTAITHTETKSKLTFHYVEMPLNIVWSSGNWSSNRFQVGAGPYVAYLANAQDKYKVKTKSTVNVDDEPKVVSEGQRQLEVGDPYKNNQLRNYDIGAGAFIGYQMASGVYVKAGAELGFLDLQKNNTLGKFYERNYNFLFTVGYMFGYKCK
ncbi:MAG: porin family protein [Bacteroidota bacterium]